MAAFLYRWVERCQNRAGGKGGRADPRGNIAAVEEFCRKIDEGSV
jgi:hypothetical protein